MTIKASEYGNIYWIQLYGYEYCTEFGPLVIVDVKGEGIDGVDDLNCSLQSTPVVKFNTSYEVEQEIPASFNFGDIRLSEITLRSDGNNELSRIVVHLDLDPVLPSVPVKLYADDTVPFKPSTSVYSYRYQISSDVENIAETADELDEDNFRDVPAEGISLEGKADGDYIVYVNTPSELPSCLKHVRVSYVAQPATSILPKGCVSDDTVTNYDLLGRRISGAVRGLQIETRGNTSRVVVK